jgi:PqqD family protein of HPr-rel-A system
VATEPAVGPPPPSLTSVDLDGRVMIFDPATGRVASLNESATAIWQLSTGEHSERELVTLVARRYGLAPEEIRADVEATLERLRREGLLSDRSE